MNVIRTRLHVAEDGTITGRAPHALPPGEHDAEIAVQTTTSPTPSEPDLWARIRALQDEVAGLPVLDHRTADEILGYGDAGLFD